MGCIISFSDEESVTYFKRKSEIEEVKEVSENILNCLVMLADGKPILLDLTIEWILNSSYKETPDEFIVNKLGIDDCDILAEYDVGILYAKQKEFEKSLVKGFENPDSPIKKIVIYLAYISPLNFEMIQYLFGDEVEERDFNEVKEYVFIKDLQTGDIVLHDEMQRLLNDYVLDNIDSDKSRRKHYSKQIIPFFKEKIEVLKEELDKKKTINENQVFEIKRELDANVVQLVKHLFVVDEFVDEAMILLTKEVNQARSNNNFTVIKELVLNASTRNMSLSQETDFITIQAKSLSAESKNEEAKKLIENFWQENEGQLTESNKANLSNMLAGIFSSMGNLKEAEKNQLFAFEVFQKDDKLSALTLSGNHLGTLYQRMGELDKALVYFKESLKNGSTMLPKNNRAFILNNIARVYLAQGEYALALDFALTAQKMWQSTHASKMMAEGKITLGDIYRDKNMYVDAEEYYNEASEVFGSYENMEEVLALMTSRAKLYWFKYEKEKKQAFLEEAQKYAEEAVKLSRENNYATELVEALSQLSNIYWSMKEKKKAKDALAEFYLLSDTHSIAYYRVDAILAFVEWGYEEQIKNLKDEIEHRVNELKNYEEKYNFPHFFGRMKIYQAHLLFDHQQYNKAMDLYEQAIVQLSEHGGYSKYSLDSELARLAQKIKMLDDKEKIIKLFTFLKTSWAKEKIDRSIVEKLLKWSESQIELTEYGM